MSAADSPISDSPFIELTPDLKQEGSESTWDRLHRRLERFSEKLNPILVKEARQALKSRQFAVTFSLLLLCAWAWSILGVVMWPEIRFSPGGFYMLAGYFWVLAFPLAVVVPFSAFRSLGMEREDGTFELVVVTTLTPRQIVAGKLVSAVMQMVVYFSALAPCIAFTYMLRGLDVFTIAFVLFYSFLTSLFLSTAGLLLATATKARHWQAVFTVLAILVCGVVFVWGAGGVSAWATFGAPLPYDQDGFWIANGIFCSAIVTYWLLLFEAAVARITFASENRSSKLRWLLLFQQMLFIGWVAFGCLVSPEPELLIASFIIVGIHWWFMGAMMSGEVSQLSQRSRRSLPQSLLGRMFLSAFSPGPGTGFLFFAMNMTLIFILGTIAELIFISMGHNRNASMVLTFGMLVYGYVVAYIGLGRLIVWLMRLRTRVNMLTAVLLQVLVALFGILVPVAIQSALSDYFFQISYSPLQVSNWFWTLVECERGMLLIYTVFGVPIVPTMVMMAAGLVTFFNVLLASTELRMVREAAPTRVQEDELALHPAEKAPKLSPWD